MLVKLSRPAQELDVPFLWCESCQFTLHENGFISISNVPDHLKLHADHGDDIESSESFLLSLIYQN